MTSHNTRPEDYLKGIKSVVDAKKTNIKTFDLRSPDRVESEASSKFTPFSNSEAQQQRKETALQV